MPRWTPEARAKQAELIRTWRPWEHSTGAKTPEGKAKVAKNSPGRYFREFVRLSNWLCRCRMNFNAGKLPLNLNAYEKEFQRRSRKIEL